MIYPKFAIFFICLKTCRLIYLGSKPLDARQHRHQYRLDDQNRRPKGIIPKHRILVCQQFQNGPCHRISFQSLTFDYTRIEDLVIHTKLFIK